MEDQPGLGWVFEAKVFLKEVGERSKLDTSSLKDIESPSAVGGSYRDFTPG